MKKLWQEFVQFVMSGNVLMIAVAFILGLAIKEVVTAFTERIMQPFIGAIFGKPSFTNTFKLGDGVIEYGAFITAVIDLLITGLVLFAIVKAYDAYRARKSASGEEPEDPTRRSCCCARSGTRSSAGVGRRAPREIDFDVESWSPSALFRL